MPVTKNIIAEEGNKRSSLPPVLGYVGYIRKDANAPDWNSPIHQHDYTEAMLCAKGEGTIVIEDRELSVKEGDIIIYPKFSVHGEQSHLNRPMEFFFMGIDSFLYPPYPSNTLLVEGGNNVFSAGPYLPQLQFYMSELLRESASCDTLFQPVLSALSSLIATTILRAQGYAATMDDKKASYGLAVKMYIDSNYKKDIKETPRNCHSGFTD